MSEHHHTISKAAAYIHSLIGPDFKPLVGIIGGSGLSGLEDAFGVGNYGDGEGEGGARVEVPYEQIPGWPRSTVPGHAGKLVFGRIGKDSMPAVLMSGRAHLYEGNDLQTTTSPIRVLALLGVKTLVVTNAAGGLNSIFKVGDVVLINDHINFPGLSGVNPLRGPNLDSFGPRFLALSDAYDLELRRTAHRAWEAIRGDASAQLVLHEGVYAYVGGPNYETRAECRMLAMLGADMVGMSTVPEVMVARHSGIRVLGISLITNMAVLDTVMRGDDPRLAEVTQHDMEKVMEDGKAYHAEVMDVGRKAALEIKKLIVKIVEMESSRS